MSDDFLSKIVRWQRHLSSTYGFSWTLDTSEPSKLNQAVHQLAKVQWNCISGTLGARTTTCKIGSNIDFGTFGKPDISKLLEIAEPAPFGKGAETVYDPAVRHAFQVSADKLQSAEWHNAENDLQYLTFGLHEHLGKMCMCGYELVPRFYKIHIYPEGGHFEQHVDTLHADNHVATLLIVLGSEHTGGELQVQHPLYPGVVHTVQGPNKWAIFYTDCPHRLTPVTSGTRVVIQYDLYSHELEDVMEFDKHCNFSVNLLPLPADVPLADTSDLEQAIIQKFEELEHRPQKSSQKQTRNPGTMILFVLHHRYPMGAIMQRDGMLKGIDMLIDQAVRNVETRLSTEHVKYRSFLVPIRVARRYYYDDSYDHEHSLFEVSPMISSTAEFAEIWNNVNRQGLLKDDVEVVAGLVAKGGIMLEHQSYSEHTGNEPQPEIYSYMSTGLLIGASSDNNAAKDLGSSSE